MHVLCIRHSISKYEGGRFFKEAFAHWFGRRDTLTIIESDREDSFETLRSVGIDAKELLICILDRAGDCVFFADGIDHTPRVRRILYQFPTAPVVISAPCRTARAFADELLGLGRVVEFIDNSAYSETLTFEDYVDPVFDALAALRRDP